MLGIGSTEFVIILFFGFLIFGPEKLPQMGRTIGRAIRQFREASEAMSKTIKTEVTDPFQEAMSPYQSQIQETVAPLQQDLNAINETMQETKESITEPFKELSNPMGTASYDKAGTRGRKGKKMGHNVRTGTKPSLFGAQTSEMKAAAKEASEQTGKQDAPQKAQPADKRPLQAAEPAQAAPTAAEEAPTAPPSEERPAAARPQAPSAGDDPFSDVVATPAAAPSEPDAHTGSSMAAALYGLDDDDAKGGE